MTMKAKEQEEEAQKDKRKQLWDTFNSDLREFFGKDALDNSDDDDVQRFLLLLGAWLNETIYYQQKAFETRSIIRNLSNYFSYVTYDKIKALYNTCLRLQQKIHKNRRLMQQLGLRKSILEDQVTESWDNLDKTTIDVFLEASRRKINCLLVTGYNLYSNAIRKVLIQKAEKRHPRKYPEVNELTGFFSQSDELAFGLGYNLGLYFLNVNWLQNEILRTKGLVKGFHTLIKSRNISKILRFIDEVNTTAMKIIGHPSYREKNGGGSEESEESSESNGFKIITWLPGARYQLNISRILLNQFNELDFPLFIIGLGHAFSIRLNKFSLETNMELPDELENVLDKKGKRVITDEIYVKHLEDQTFSSVEQEIAAMQGILVRRIGHLEKMELGVEPLMKRFSFLFRHFSQKKIIKLQAAIYQSMISLWIKREIEKDINNTTQIKQSYLPLPRIRLQLVKSMRDLEEDPVNGESPQNVLALIQGYDLYSHLYNKYNPSAG